MKLINPAEISAKIMTLIDNAERELIIISPYNKITGWVKLINRIKKTQNKGVKIKWYSRGNDVNDNNSDEVKKNLGIKPILINDLHAKIYMNEASAIFTSMNLSKISDDKSIDLGYITENRTEYNEILNFVNKHIEILIEKDSKNELSNAKDGKTTTEQILSEANTFNAYHLNGIHNHILEHYGKFRFKYEEECLEYFDFIRRDYMIQFINYEESLKIHIWFPNYKSAKNIADRIENRKKSISLTFKHELECYDSEQYIKYYYKSNLKIKNWGKNQLKFFLEDLDILIDLVFEN